MHSTLLFACLNKGSAGVGQYETFIGSLQTSAFTKAGNSLKQSSIVETELVSTYLNFTE